MNHQYSQNRRASLQRKGGVLAIAAIFLLTACGSVSTDSTVDAAPLSDDWSQVVAAAKKEGVVNVRSVFIEEVEREIYKSFTEEYGIEVKYSKKGGSGPTAAAYLTEMTAGASDADILQIAVAAGQDLVDKGYIADVSLPNDANLLPAFTVEGPAPMRAQTGALSALVYNTTMVDADDVPQSYEELLDPKWANALAMSSPHNSYTVLMWAYAMEDVNGADFLERLGEQAPMVTDKDLQAAELVARGERPLALLSSPTPSALIKSGAPLDRAFPANSVAVPGMILIPKAAPNPNAARLFANWQLEQSTQTQWVEKHDLVGVVKGVAAPKGQPDLSEITLFEYDVRDVLSTRDELLALWDKEMR